MAKLQFVYNKETSYMYYDRDPKYNELAIKATIGALHDHLVYDGLITVKEVLKKFGFDTKEIPTETLIHYWTEEMDITYKPTENPNEYLLTFETDG